MQKRSNEKKISFKWLWLVLILAIILLFLFLFFKPHTNNQTKSGQLSSDTLLQKKPPLRDSILPSDSNVTTPKSDTVIKIPNLVRKPDKKKDTVTTDSQATVQQDTSTLQLPDTAQKKDTSAIIDPCKSDTTAPWIYPDPSGGLHKKQVRVYFVSNKPSKVEWKFKNDKEWNLYNGSPVVISSTVTLEFRAIDSCGRRMDLRDEYYELERAESIQYCPDGMEYIKVGANKFCIDRYEWPNRKGRVPLSYISKYGASDSCYSVGKHLCTEDEWMLACMGPYSWKYPYGQVYEPYACSTNDTTVAAAGSKPECRSFFGVFDMSGGLAEWTDSRAVENRQFYYVKGGFWESGPQSSCFDKRYSYYPQNRHNPVGFRCCMDAATESDQKKK